MPHKPILFFILFFILLTGCKKENDSHQASDTKEITSFVLRAADNNELTQDVRGIFRNDTILLNILPGVSLNHLTPTIAMNGASITPGNHTPADFTQPVRYTVTAEDGSTRIYTVLVHIINGRKSIVTFAFRTSENTSVSMDATGVITNDSVIVHLPAHANLTSLIPDITFEGVSISPGDGVAMDFTQPVNYTVTADDGSSVVYRVFASTNFAVFIGSSNGHLYSLNAVTGKPIWEYYAGGQVSSPVYANGNVYAGNQQSFFAVDAATGTLKWSNNIFRGAFTAPAIENGTVYAGYRLTPTLTQTAGNYLYAFDENTGTVKWSKKLNPGIDNYGTASAPTVANGVVYISEYNTGMRAIDGQTGNTIWSAGHASISKPFVNAGMLYYGSTGAIATAVNISGQHLWSSAGGNIISGPIFNNGTVYAGGWTATTSATIDDLFALDATNGSVRWKYPNVNYSLAGRFSTPSFFNNTVYAGNNDNLVYAVDATTGALKWNYGNGRIASNATPPNPVATGGIVFISREAHSLYALNATTGILQWQFTGDGGINTDPCIIDITGTAIHYPGH